MAAAVKAGGERVALHTGALMPLLGLGTWQSDKGKVSAAVAHALKGSYRHIDAAWIYGNEAEVGEGLADALKSGVNREDVFLTTKLWNKYHQPRYVERTLRESLSRLGVDYVDLYLIHWPFGFRHKEESNFPDSPDDYESVAFNETWKALEACVEKGLVRHIGLSNFNIAQIQEVLKGATIKPAVLQVESHPYMNQLELIDFCSQNNIVVTAYSPLGSPGTFDGKPSVLETEVVKSIAEKHGKTAAQVAIRYQIDRGVVVIPKSVTPARIDANWNVWDFKLTDEDLAQLNGFEEQIRFCAFSNAKDHPQYPF